MRKVLLAASMLIAALSAKAQITITNADLPSGGDTLRYSTVSVVGLNLDDQIAKAGVMQRWNFSTLQPNDQGVDSWKNALATPYAFYFTGKVGVKTQDTLDLGVAKLTDVYTFYTKNSTVFKAEGLGYKISGLPLAINNTDDDEIYRLPLDYGDRDSDTYHIELGIGGFIPVSYVQSGTRYNHVDGFGKIVTPYDSFNCLRVKTVIDAVDTIKNSLFPVPVPSKRIEYKWLAPNQKIPVMEISGTEVAGTFTITSVRYRDKPRVITGPSNPLEPVVSVTINKHSVMAGKDTITFQANVVNFASSTTWDIQPSGGLNITSGGLDQERVKLIFNYPGTYTVKFEASNPFGSDDTTCTGCIVVSPGTGIAAHSWSRGVVYPNPASTIVYLPEGTLAATLFDMSGKQLLSLEKGNSLELQALAQGLYLIEWSDATGLHREQLLVKP